MEDNTLNVIVHNGFYRALTVLSKKAPEYTDKHDRLSNFKKAGVLQGITAEQALFGMLAKHLVSLAEMVAKGESSQSMWEEKLTDAQNYLFLLEGLLVEKHGWPRFPTSGVGKLNEVKE